MADTEQPVSETIRVTIDGVEHYLPKVVGKTIIEVCDGLGIVIPRFCYHPALSAPGNCRMCLVEIEGLPKLQPACHTPIGQGMVLYTKSERVKKARASVLELLLVNHPVDCPICDQAGECPLQDQYYEHDLRRSVIGPPERKVKKSKALRVGPRIVLDQERCVLCTRCTRFMAEVVGEPQLGMFWRNDHSYISIAPGQPLDSNYSLNAAAICPVGALTGSDFRFKKRVWDLKSVRSICDGCSRGCNCWLDVDDSKVFRIRARENESVNGSWMCDLGLLSYRAMNEKRLLTARLDRVEAPLMRASLDAAGQIATRMKSLVGNTAKLAILVSSRVSTEDALMAAYFTSEVMKGDKIYVGGREEEEGDDLLLREDRNPNRLGVILAARAFGLEVSPFDDLLEAVDAGEVTVVYGVGEDVPTVESLAAEVFSSLEYFVLQASNSVEIARAADVVLPTAALAECDGSFVNFSYRLQRFQKAFVPRGEALPHWGWLIEVARQMGETIGYEKASEVYSALAKRSAILCEVSWDSVSFEGVRLAGIGEEDERGGRVFAKMERGVSRWPR